VREPGLAWPDLQVLHCSTVAWSTARATLRVERQRCTNGWPPVLGGVLRLVAPPPSVMSICMKTEERTGMELCSGARGHEHGCARVCCVGMCRCWRGDQKSHVCWFLTGKKFLEVSAHAAQALWLKCWCLQLY